MKYTTLAFMFSLQTFLWLTFLIIYSQTQNTYCSHGYMQLNRIDESSSSTVTEVALSYWSWLIMLSLFEEANYCLIVTLIYFIYEVHLYSHKVVTVYIRQIRLIHYVTEELILDYSMSIITYLCNFHAVIWIKQFIMQLNFLSVSFAHGKKHALLISVNHYIK